MGGRESEPASGGVAAMLAQATDLRDAGELVEALALLDRALALCDASAEVEQRELTARVLGRRASVLKRAGRAEELTQTLGEIVRRFEGAEEPVLRTAVAGALILGVAGSALNGLM